MNRLSMSTLAIFLAALQSLPSPPFVSGAKARKPDREAIEAAERKRQRKRAKRLRQGRP